METKGRPSLGKISQSRSGVKDGNSTRGTAGEWASGPSRQRAFPSSARPPSNNNKGRRPAGYRFRRGRPEASIISSRRTETLPPPPPPTPPQTKPATFASSHPSLRFDATPRKYPGEFALFGSAPFGSVRQISVIPRCSAFLNRQKPKRLPTRLSTFDKRQPHSRYSSIAPIRHPATAQTDLHYYYYYYSVSSAKTLTDRRCRCRVYYFANNQLCCLLLLAAGAVGCLLAWLLFASFPRCCRFVYRFTIKTKRFTARLARSLYRRFFIHSIVVAARTHGIRESCSKKRKSKTTTKGPNRWFLETTASQRRSS